MSGAWRLLVHNAADGYTNMAVDEAIMQLHAEGLTPATLRFYRWSPPCVSLGYFQSGEGEVDLEACQRQGVQYVRRTTGGRAILHDAELTYSVVAGEEDPSVAGSILESYRKISTSLVTGLRCLGVPAEMKRARRVASPAGGAERRQWSALPDEERPLTAACFDVPSDYEIAVEGRKLVGSAQTRHSGVILQHGSILLEVDPAQIFTVLRSPQGTERSEAARWLAERVTSLKRVLGREVSFEELAEALRAGFARGLEVDLVPGALTEEEHQLAERLKREKYATADWNLRR